ncbi:MAG: hypothetical protein IJP33_05150 [Firmicutes bacterium]|nr:hypothetical protein [Bacillota bacterium]
MTAALKVRMFETFSLQYGDKTVDDRSNSMKKVWLLLAYLIFCRNSYLTQDSFISLLQGAGSDEGADPNGRLKALIYRARTLLNQLDDIAGHDWIVRKKGTYSWNTDIPLELDVDEFEALCKQADRTDDENERLNILLQALEIYRGDFLPKLSMEPWVMPINTYYHQMFLNAVEQALLLLEKNERYNEITSLCKKALKIEPYSEEIYQHLMKALIAQDKRSEALQVYEDMSELLFSTFGVMPSDESRALYRGASREEKSFTVPIGTVREQLKEPAAAKGAVYCEYDFFKLLYQVQARAIIRSGEVIHIALFSLHGPQGKSISRRSLDIAMNNLQELVISSLRQGDIVSRCSVSQLIVMLPQANYENSCSVCQRILKAFNRQYPHSPLYINYSVQPIEPMNAAPHPHI